MSEHGEKWCLGATWPNKVVHRRSCAHARADYGWARDAATDADSLAFVLVRSGAYRWHRACKRCCADLDRALASWADHLAIPDSVKETQR